MRDHLSAAVGSPLPSPETIPAPTSNEVHALLRANLAREQAAGLHADAPPVPRRSRRRRDYFITLIGGNLLIVASGFLGSFNVVVTVYTFAGVILFSIGLTWVLWFVMDDY